MKIQYHRTFQKQFPKLPPWAQEQFYQRLELFVQDKFNDTLNNHSVDIAYPGCRSINITGDYRAIFREENDTVTFTNIGTHSQLY